MAGTDGRTDNRPGERAGSNEGGNPQLVVESEHEAGIGSESFTDRLRDALGADGGDGERPRKRRGRRPKAETEGASVSEPVTVITPRKRRGQTVEIPAEALAPAIAAAFAVVARVRRSPVWVLNDAEVTALAVPCASLISRLPIPAKQAGIAVDLVALGAVAVPIVGGRVLEERRQRQPMPGPFPSGQFTNGNQPGAGFDLGGIDTAPGV
jgi:hypothetical protein